MKCESVPQSPASLPVPSPANRPEVPMLVLPTAADEARRGRNTYSVQEPTENIVKRDGTNVHIPGSSGSAFGSTHSQDGGMQQEIACFVTLCKTCGESPDQCQCSGPKPAMIGGGNGVEAALMEILSTLESHKLQLSECVAHNLELRNAVESVTSRV